MDAVGWGVMPRLLFPLLVTAVGFGKIHNDEFADERLPIGHKAALAGGQTRQIREFHPLHRSFDTAQ